MLLAIYAAGTGYAATQAALFLFGCVLIFLFYCLSFRVNRTKHGIIFILLSLLANEIIYELVWFLVFFPRGNYLNPGLHGGLYGLGLWPTLLLLTGIFVTKRSLSRGKVR